MRLLVVASSEQELQGLSRFSPGNDAFLERLLPCGAGELVGVPVGVGMVLAALGTFSAILKWRPDHVLVYGTGGAVSTGLELGDLVVADEVVQYGLDLRPFGLKRGESFGPYKEPAGGTLRPMLRIPQLEGVRIVGGVVGSADMFALRPWRDANPWLVDELHVVLTDMESYAMASACHQCYVPCCVARVVSDTSEGRRTKHYARFMSETVGGILCKAIDSVSDKF